jgi:opacity protein-like surface antigen
MRRFALAAVVAAVLASLALPAASQANVDVQQTDEAGNTTQLASFKSAKCRRGNKRALLKFTAKGKNNGWTLTVDIFRGGNLRDNLLTYGGDGDAQFTVSGPGGSFSNLNRPPNAPPGGGAIVFGRGGKRMGLGFSRRSTRASPARSPWPAASTASTPRRSGAAGADHASRSHPPAPSAGGCQTSSGGRRCCDLL